MGINIIDCALSCANSLESLHGINVFLKEQNVLWMENDDLRLKSKRGLFLYNQSQQPYVHWSRASYPCMTLIVGLQPISQSDLLKITPIDYTAYLLSPLAMWPGFHVIYKL